MRLPWKLCFEQSMLSIKRIYAFWQTYFCFLSNVRLFTIKYIVLYDEIIIYQTAII